MHGVIQMGIKKVNNKLVQLVKLMKTLTDKELESVLLNRALLDRIYLMRKSNKTDRELIEKLTFRELVIFESLVLK